MGLADDSAETSRIGVWEQEPEPTVIMIDAPLWKQVTESQLRYAQKVGNARAEVLAAIDALRDNASRYFLGKTLERALEALR